MDFEQPEERRMLVATIDRYLDDRYDLDERSRIARSPEGWSREHWRELANLGVIGALFPEGAGGLAGSGFDIAAVFGSLGRRLVVEPFLGTLMAGHMLASAGRGDLLEEMIQGKRIILAACEEGAIVAQAAAADAFVMSDGKSLYLVDSTDVTRSDAALFDGGRGAENVMFCQVSENRIGEALPIVEAATAAGLVALCAEAVAIMDVIRDQTLEYLRTRKQFGQPIGQFQVLKHRMATVALEIEQARSAATNAAALLEGERIARERAVSAAKFTIGRAGTLVAEEAIQMHGGIGMTWELPLTHYAKRLVMIGHLLGDEDHHLDRYIALGRAAA